MYVHTYTHMYNHKTKAFNLTFKLEWACFI